MQAQPQNVVVNSHAEEDLVELDLQDLTHVGGGAPKGTWLTGVGATVSIEVAARLPDTEPAPKGTW
jgi:hypothetical protein